MTRPHVRLGGVAFACALASQLPQVAHGQEELEEVRVTGSRISQTSGMTTPTPVTAVTSAELAQMSPGNIVDALSQLPQFSGNIGSEQIIGGQNSGGANVNLRGAGVNRTLVLLDGRRVVSSNRFGTVDINMFPEALLRGIETVTGGASASYGTDAVAGVVNFLLDTDFEGIKAHVQGGQTGQSDGRNYEANLAFGRAFGSNFHVVGSVMFDEVEAIGDFSSLQDRPYFNQVSRVTNPDPNGPTEIIRPYVAPTNFTNGGIIVEPNFPTLNRLEFLPNGTVSPLPFTGVGSLNAGCQCYASADQTFGVERDTEIAPGYRRSNAFLHLGYDIGDNSNVYLQGLHGTTRNNDRRESISLLSVWQGRLYADNPFLPASVRQEIQNVKPANQQFVGFGMFALNNPDTPLGDSRQITENTMELATLGFKTEFSSGFLEGFQLDSYVQYGKNEQDFITQNGIRTDRLPLALDVVLDANGRPVCRVSLPQYDPAGNFSDCAPVNLVGGLGNLTPEAVAWIRDDGKVARQEVEQQVAEVVLSGDLWQGFGAGPVAGAFGLSYRKDELDQRTMDPSDEFPALPDGTLLSSLGLMSPELRGVLPETAAGGIPGLRFVPTGFSGDQNSSTVLFSSLRTIAGEYDVKEAFAEFRIPVLKDLAWAQALELSTAGRWASYSGSGSIWAWKLGASYTINDQVRLRATQSRDVRAATLQERFDQTRGGVTVQDPARLDALGRRESRTTASFSGGNPLVDPEEADTTTVGIVYQPSFLEGFSMSVDWYSIDINDAIAQLTAQNVVDGCFTGDVSLCQFVHRRDGLSNGEIERVDNLFINLANHKISGIDLETSFNRSLRIIGGGPESLTWRLYAAYLGENSIQNQGSNTRDERAGQVGGGIAGAGGLPKYRVTSSITYRNGPISAFLQGRWIDGGVLDRLRVESTTRVPDSIDDNSVPSVFYTDLNVDYVTGQDDNLNLYLTVTNLFDREPPAAPQAIGRAGVTEFNTSLYDVIGRRYVVGVNYRF